ncbi:hypothetical protein NSMS1_16390 [Nostoc sp. MS1]|nr:hypothetical protein NSMS1_16390 [Nostoc sp. MS1]
MSKSFWVYILVCFLATFCLSPANWTQYAGINFEFIPQFVGAIFDETTITLDMAYTQRPFLKGKNYLIKLSLI